jgi:two-component system, OmpR family, catabolic regulation response regulator CreB
MFVKRPRKTPHVEDTILNQLSKRTILIIEDEPGIVDTLVYSLSTEGFDALTSATGREGLALLRGQRIDLVVLDIGLPDASGFDVLREIRTFSRVPVLFLTARSGEIDRVLGLELGADDYVVKPFSPREIVSRVKAILRRTGTPAGSGARPGAFSVDEQKRSITYCGVRLLLPRYEYDILRLFISRPGWVFSREQIMDLVWTEPDESFERTVDAHIKSIRGKLRSVRDDQDPIMTHRGVGYSLREDLCP